MSNIIIPNEIIQDKIYLIRNQKVMLDIDLAKMFEVTPRRLREQVSRNPDKFPEHFMFRLNEVETEIMISQNAIPSKKHWEVRCPMFLQNTGFCNYQML